MIIDLISNWKSYFAGAPWEAVFDFLERVGPDTPETRHPIAGEDAFAPVFTITTKLPEQGKLEGHRKYIDIQAPLTGIEGMEWFPAGKLAVQTAYDAEKDLVIFERRPPAPARVDVRPGMFALFWPEDAHLPGLAVGEPASLRKCVVKVRVEAVRPKR